MKSIILEKEELHLLPEKAIYWPSTKRLLIADLHIGKIMHFRKNGIAIPPMAIQKNLENLSYLLLNYEIEEVYFLGDLFHSAVNAEWSLFLECLQKFENIRWHLIIGNHDEMNTNFYEHASMQIHEKLVLGPFMLTHHPTETKEYNLCGHIHPGIRITGKGRQSLRFSCFHFGPRQGVLPAFGAFTGMYMMEENKDAEIYAILEDQLLQIQ